MDFFDEKTSWIITFLVIVLFVALSVISFAEVKLPYISWLQKGIYNLVSPVVEYFTYGYSQITSFYSGIMRAGEIVEENQYLKRKVDRLENEINIRDSSLRQDKRLEKLESFLDAFKEFSEYEVKGASVIGYGPSNWGESMIINQGSRDGIEEKMPVISYNGVLVGMISNTGANSSQVMLVNNPDFAVGGIVQDSRVIGIVKGQLGKRDKNIMEKIPADADIKEDDRILTSGLSNNFPKYLPIGKVVDVKTDNFGVSKIAEIDLFLRDYTVEEVLVITDF
ncbi:MAG: rod shape-determining protein MreC [Bacillota bacterium]